MSEVPQQFRRWLLTLDDADLRALLAFSHELRWAAFPARLGEQPDAVRRWLWTATTAHLGTLAVDAIEAAAEVLVGRLDLAQDVVARPDRAQLGRLLADLGWPVGRFVLFGLLIGDAVASPLAIRHRTELEDELTQAEQPPTAERGKGITPHSAPDGAISRPADSAAVTVRAAVSEAAGVAASADGASATKVAGSADVVGAVGVVDQVAAADAVDLAAGVEVPDVAVADRAAGVRATDVVGVDLTAGVDVVDVALVSNSADVAVIAAEVAELRRRSKDLTDRLVDAVARVAAGGPAGQLLAPLAEYDELRGRVVGALGSFGAPAGFAEFDEAVAALRAGVADRRAEAGHGPSAKLHKQIAALTELHADAVDDEQRHLYERLLGDAEARLAALDVGPTTPHERDTSLVSRDRNQTGVTFMRLAHEPPVEELPLALLPGPVWPLAGADDHRAAPSPGSGPRIRTESGSHPPVGSEPENVVESEPAVLPEPEVLTGLQPVSGLGSEFRTEFEPVFVLEPELSARSEPEPMFGSESRFVQGSMPEVGRTSNSESASESASESSPGTESEPMSESRSAVEVAPDPGPGPESSPGVESEPTFESASAFEVEPDPMLEAMSASESLSGFEAELMFDPAPSSESVSALGVEAETEQVPEPVRNVWRPPVPRAAAEPTPGLLSVASGSGWSEPEGSATVGELVIGPWEDGGRRRPGSWSIGRRAARHADPDQEDEGAHHADDADETGGTGRRAARSRPVLAPAPVDAG